MMSAPLLAEIQKLNTAGWLMMIGCIGLVCGLVAFCFRRVLREARPSEHLHGPLDIDTGNADDES